MTEQFFAQTGEPICQVECKTAYRQLTTFRESLRNMLDWDTGSTGGLRVKLNQPGRP